MNESEDKFGGSGESGIEELRREVQSLRAALSASVLLLFIFSFCVNVYLWHQSSLIHAQAMAAPQVVYDFDNGGAGQAIEFWTHLNDYARAHPDFVPIINKYSKFINVHNAATAAILTMTTKRSFRLGGYCIGVKPCQIYSKARGRVWAFTAPSQWLAFLAKTN